MIESSLILVILWWNIILTCPSLSKVGEKNDTHYEAKIGVILTVFIIIFSKDLYLCIYQYNKYKAEGYVLNHLIFLEKILQNIGQPTQIEWFFRKICELQNSMFNIGVHRCYDNKQKTNRRKLSSYRACDSFLL